ncbi:hypothetical protein [Flavobacterium sp. KACC 22761]|uniref:hypothetical protein n=1 Tax=Flavobacterium sp. KACC 22761 TaxID=3092665 RepID=UPI002A7654C6|nr:hypothetical protein [Flavobacterium sp. KACC 22761]WPO77050.1 hypothetical protein SCB73_12340 [Flavobacterium sp. KACC 22761]
MTKKLLFIILILFQFSCKDKAEKQAETWNKRIQEAKISTKAIPKFDFEKFQISNGKVGEIKIGMTISDAEKLLKSLTKKEETAYDFGYDGGGKAFLYSLKNEPVIALVPKRDSEEILAIIALSKNLKTENGLNPKSTVAEIQEKYPDIKVYIDLIMDWEFMTDKKSNLEFDFFTKESNRIGEYTDLEIPVKPVRTTIKADWITIK